MSADPKPTITVSLAAGEAYPYLFLNERDPEDADSTLLLVELPEDLYQRFDDARTALSKLEAEVATWCLETGVRRLPNFRWSGMDRWLEDHERARRYAQAAVAPSVNRE
jgi:hypothetical protein